MDPILAAGILAVALAAGLTLVAWRRAATEEDLELAIESGVEEPLDDYEERLAEPLPVRLLKPVGRDLADRLTRLLPANYMEELSHDLWLAGLRRQTDVELHLVVRLISAVAGVGLGFLAAVSIGGGRGLGLAILVIVAGFFLPRAWLARLKGQRQGRIRRELPDVLDLLAISVEAGVGLEGAMAVAVEHFDSPLGDEFAQTLREMELGLPRRDALGNLRERTDVPELSSFIVTLIQADVLGMPLGRVLRTQADDMRMRRRQMAREAAAKLPVKMVFPLVVLIMPALFVVILGPAVIEIARNLL